MPKVPKESSFPGIDAPAKGSVLFTDVDSDTVDLDVEGRALHVNGAGNIKVTMPDGSTPTFAVNAGTTYPYRVTRVWETGLTATGYVLF